MRSRRRFKISHYNVLQLRMVLFIALFWTLIDLVITLLDESKDISFIPFLYRELFIFLTSIIIGYIFVYKLKRLFLHMSLWASFLLRSAIMMFIAFCLIFALQFVNEFAIQGYAVDLAWNRIIGYALHGNWLIRKILYWQSIFFVTQLILIINEKYSPGVFVEILSGKYSKPQNEKRIVMFIDLRNSTHLAEKMGHGLYFSFISEFIYQVSRAIIECDGRIYQYVGDEIVCSWRATQYNARKCMTTIIQARRNIQNHSEKFKDRFGEIPDFRVGVHAGEVSIGEIGIFKKDLAMSGDTMNTTARIRSAFKTLKHHFVVSKEFLDLLHLKSYQYYSLGEKELKGKDEKTQLYNLNI